MFFDNGQTVCSDRHLNSKHIPYENMTWSPSSKHFRSPDGSPQSYRRILHPTDSRGMDNESSFFDGTTSPTFPRKILRDVWEESSPSNHEFRDRPRLFKRVFTPNRWSDDDFEHTRNSVRQLARDFDRDFDTRNIGRDFDTNFHREDRGHKPDIEDFEKAAGRVHHIPIKIERRLEEMRSKFSKKNIGDLLDYCDEADEWQEPRVRRLEKNFEKDDDFANICNKHRLNQNDPIKTRAFTIPTHSKWDPENVHTLPTKKTGKAFKVYDDCHAGPKPVFRSYSETQHPIPKQQQQTHTAAFRSHSDGHCPKTTYVTKISVNVSPNQENDVTVANGDTENECASQGFESSANSNTDSWNSHQNRQRPVFRNQNEFPSSEPESPTSSKERTQTHTLPDVSCKSEDKPLKWTSSQKIAAVMKNVDDLLVRVNTYNGCGRDKQYRFLDEMLTRCMLTLDDVDIEGKEDIRSARKAAVMQVQACIEKLEAKADESEQLEREKSHNMDKDMPDRDDSSNNVNTTCPMDESSIQYHEESSTENDNEQTKL